MILSYIQIHFNMPECKRIFDQFVNYLYTCKPSTYYATWNALVAFKIFGYALFAQVELTATF